MQTHPAIQLLLARFPRVSWGVASAVFCVLTAGMTICSCDLGNRTTRVDGPTFFGFDYTPETFNGNWSGSLTAHGSFQTLRLAVAGDGAQITGVDSRGKNVTFGVMKFKNSATGEMELDLKFQDAVSVTAVCLLEPGVNRISGKFFATFGVFGDLVLKRYTPPGDFPAQLSGMGYSVKFIDSDTDEERTGAFQVGPDEHLLAGGTLDGKAIAAGLLEGLDPEGGIFGLTLSLESGELVIASGLLSLADGRLAGTYEGSLPNSSGLFGLDPAK